MTVARPRPVVPLTALWAAFALFMAGCRITAASPHVPGQQFTLPAVSTSVLIVVTDRDSPSAIAGMGRLIPATARPGERIFIMDDRGGAVLASAVAPPPPATPILAPPRPLPPGATEFQQSLHDRALRTYRDRVTRALARLQTLEAKRLQVWAEGLTARADADLKRADDSDGGIRPALVAALADITSLRQAGANVGTRIAIALLGIDGVAARSAPAPPAGLHGATVIVDDFPGTSQDEAVWRDSFLRTGASRAVLLAAATDDELPVLVSRALAS